MTDSLKKHYIFPFRLKTIVSYVPQIIPPPPSPLRQNAYLEGTFLPGPDRDPDGWVTLPSVVVCGKVQLAQFLIDVECTVRFRSIYLFPAFLLIFWIL